MNVAESETSAVPNVMPFDAPYGSPITLERATRLIALATAEAKRRNWKMVISVVDPNGDLVAVARMDGAEPRSIDISQKKARVAARSRRADGITAAGGGVPLVADGRIIGAIGASGGLSSQGALTARAALAAEE